MYVGETYIYIASKCTMTSPERRGGDYYRALCVSFKGEVMGDGEEDLPILSSP